MGISIRYYLFLEDGALRRVPQRISNQLPFGRDAIPEFADSRRRVAQVVVELDDSKPVRILDARGFYWTFDADGRIDEDLQRTFVERMDAHDAAARGERMRVVDLVPEIKRRELQAKHEWTPSANDLDRIAADLWPGVHGPAPDVATVKGKVPRKPPLTTEGKWALDDIAKSVDAITIRLGELSERALKGLAFEAHRTSTLEDQALWCGVAEEAKRCEAIRAAHRTGRGEWYAVLEVMRDEPSDPIIRHHVVTEHVKCANCKEAIEAGRKLMAEKVEWLSEGTFVEAAVRSALEWRPEEWG